MSWFDDIGQGARSLAESGLDTFGRAQGHIPGLDGPIQYLQGGARNLASQLRSGDGMSPQQAQAYANTGSGLPGGDPWSLSNRIASTQPPPIYWGDKTDDRYKNFGIGMNDAAGNKARTFTDKNGKEHLQYDFYGNGIPGETPDNYNNIPTQTQSGATTGASGPGINRNAPDTSRDQGQNAIFDLAQQNEAFRSSRIADWQKQLASSPYDFNSAMNQQKLAQQGAAIQAAGAAQERAYQEVHRGGIGADESGVMQNDTNFRQAQNANTLQNDLFNQNVDYGNKVRAALDSLQGNDMGGSQLENFNNSKTTSTYNDSYLKNLQQQTANQAAQGNNALAATGVNAVTSLLTPTGVNAVTSLLTPTGSTGQRPSAQAPSAQAPSAAPSADTSTGAAPSADTSTGATQQQGPPDPNTYGPVQQGPSPYSTLSMPSADSGPEFDNAGNPVNPTKPKPLTKSLQVSQ